MEGPKNWQPQVRHTKQMSLRQVSISHLSCTRPSSMPGERPVSWSLFRDDHSKRITLLGVIPTVAHYILKYVLIYILVFNLTFYQAFYLAFYVVFCLAVYLTYTLTLYLASHLTFCLRYILAFYLIFEQAFYLHSIKYLSGILPDIYSDILSGTLSDRISGILFEIDIISHFYLAFYLA